jgi:hypothetical protein
MVYESHQIREMDREEVREITIWVKHPRDKPNNWWLVGVIFCKLHAKLERS